MAAKRKSSTPARSSKSQPKAARAAKPAPNGADDRLTHLQRLIELMEQKSVVEVELEEAGTRWRVRRTDPHAAVGAFAPAMPTYAPAMVLPGTAPATPSAAPAAPAGREVEGEVFKSPMLGTFYRAASPEAEPFAKAGDKVSADRTLCIIEAMKVMNEIKAEREFEIVDVLVKNGEPVEFGQPLFVIR
jgi:acetyl-CoA carboxylase biotin carboxyl carrier protein